MSRSENSSNTKAVLITGGARRIGAAITRLLHATGMDVIVHYRNSADAALALQEELHAHRPGSVTLCQADLTNSGACETLTQCAHQAFGRLDALINNASAFYPTPVDRATEAEWEDLFAVNLKAPFFLAQACAPMLAMQSGAIINLADIYAKRPLAQHPIQYSAMVHYQDEWNRYSLRYPFFHKFSLLQELMFQIHLYRIVYLSFYLQSLQFQ